MTAPTSDAVREAEKVLATDRAERRRGSFLCESGQGHELVYSRPAVGEGLYRCNRCAFEQTKSERTRVTN